MFIRKNVEIRHYRELWTDLKVSEIIPSGIFSVVLSELTKRPTEFIDGFKIAFLENSEVKSNWVANKVSNLSQYESLGWPCFPDQLCFHLLRISWLGKKTKCVPSDYSCCNHINS